MAAKDRYKIIYNNLIDLIDEMSVPANYHILIDGIIHGKKNEAIADEIGVTPLPAVSYFIPCDFAPELSLP